MKYMRLGTRPDTFHTEEATRTVISDVASDLTININSISYLLHKHEVLSYCGLLQQLCSDSDNIALELHDIPGGEDAFELCAKFCYGITINLGAHNIVPALCAAKFLGMTEAVEKGNLVLKLEAFLNSCILEGWKDSILTLQTTGQLPEWSENLGITRRCIDSIVERILTPPAKVTWSYTYTRPGYAQKRHRPVPKDWWTEDVSDLDIDLFRCVLTAVRSTNLQPPQLIGEALHVYTCRWLPDTTKSWSPQCSTSQTEEFADRKPRILETIASLIPADRGSVSIGFLLRLLRIANFLGVSPVTKAELIRRSSLQLEEATVDDLLLPSQLSSNGQFHDVDLIGAVLESFLLHWRRLNFGEHGPSVLLIRKVGKLIDSYLQVVAADVNMPVAKVVSLAEALPEIARPTHDDLYKAINTYLKEHPGLTKAEKKQLCRILNCQKLSPEVCAHAVRNERLPLRTVVQVLFFEQERGGSSSRKPLGAAASHIIELPPDHDDEEQPTTCDEQSSSLRADQGTTDQGSRYKKCKSNGKMMQLKPKQDLVRREADKGGDHTIFTTRSEEAISGSAPTRYVKNYARDK
ncbi:BTB/POZ domain-containing protein At5g47800 isoform X2 [Diospyros lotus]|uniref:BTB/POZ domain-containing protein At5g47800 isoform X2 n=1 Tax=Diospyros lotus TaxID=55363 RepID=UPI002259D70B|nr:BTB/POZ domain-containing protein At5g47800 isoform X2 [Diospyros lotus]